MPDEPLEDRDGPVEHFAPTAGRVTGVLGLLLAAAVLVTGIVRPGGVVAPIMALAVLGGAVAWAAQLRPRVSVSPETLYLRNMVETVEIPLAAVDELVVRQVLAVRVGDKRFVCPGLGRKLRKIVRKPKAQSLFLPEIPESMPDAIGPAAATPTVATEVDYVDHAETRLRDLVDQARRRHGVTRYSDEAEALAAGVRRRPAWPEIVVLAGSAAAFLLFLVL